MKREKDISSTGKLAVNSAHARARVNRFLLSQVGSQFCAGDAELDALNGAWRVPILLVTPGLVVGQVGEASIATDTRELESHTEIKKIYESAERLRKRRNAAIESAFLRARER